MGVEHAAAAAAFGGSSCVVAYGATGEVLRQLDLDRFCQRLSRISWSFPLLVFGFLLPGSQEERLLASTTPAEIGAFELGHLVIEGARVVPEPTPTFIRLCPHESDGRLEGAMATRTVDEAFCRGLLAGARVGKPLPMLYYLDRTEEPTWRALGYLLQCRRNGFMVILPLEVSVKAQLQAAAEDAEIEPPIFAELEVECETHRKRPVGPVTALFCDLPWAALGSFRKAQTGRVALVTHTILSSDRAVVRPLVESALEVADRWVSDSLVGEAAETGLAEYVTGESGEEFEPEPVRVSVLSCKGWRPKLPSLLHRRRRQQDDNHELLLHELCSRPKQANPSWARPQKALGEDVALHEQDLEANEGELDFAGGSNEALLKLLATQTQLLAKLATPKAVDPITSALGSGGGSGSEGANVSGARGMVAREAYLKALEKPTEFSAAIARRAQAELGWSQQTPGMMRSYLERKVPLKDHRTLTLMGFYLAHMWEAARESGNIEFESWASRGLLMVEQWAIDNGRSQAAWLLSGLPASQ
ncbi:unnamed protein product [Symbiodinium necroappetens]|uniref:Uncharacterized protein n=1 Tax=Symbiodinium necroappetens TaxID=1628268 RepID=A0A812MQK8_9DINO|nr:unnamed protein product [Symbiodinium necroappetens]